MDHRFAERPADPLGIDNWPGSLRLPTGSERKEFLAGTIISVSGWRRVFALDGDPESRLESISFPAGLFAACAGYLLGRRLAERHGRRPWVALALDTRPTGPQIGYCALRGLLAAEARVNFIGVAPTPEAMAYTAVSPGPDGLIVVTASHNPLGHNGVKFSAGDGQVLEEPENEILLARLLDLYGEGRGLDLLYARIRGLQSSQIEAVYSLVPRMKKRSLAAYGRRVARTVTAERSASRAANVLAGLREALAARPLGIVAELNGSARTLSIDRKFLEETGLRVRALNAEPGRIAHDILPEGDSLLPACRVLELAALEDPAFELGYVPDNDGDRGNVVWLGADGEARPLEAQEVFALAVVAELSFLAASGVVTYDSQRKPSRRLAVVVNCCTSARIEAIAEKFGARVFRAEVGEANVVGLAARLRSRGWLVRILGEGSNGGNITHPSRVRDPLNTVLAFVKLLRLDGVLEQWRSRAGASLAVGATSLDSVVRSLPRWYSTGQYESRSVVEIACQDHDRLKSSYEEIFPARWREQGAGLAGRLGVSSFRFMNYEGQRSFEGPGRRSPGGRGGFKTQLLAADGREAGWAWMRGSKTEPVFRVMADVSTSAGDERELLELHCRILLEADSLAARSRGD